MFSKEKKELGDSEKVTENYKLPNDKIDIFRPYGGKIHQRI